MLDRLLDEEGTDDRGGFATTLKISEGNLLLGGPPRT